jgi:hypothetical protein
MACYLIQGQQAGQQPFSVNQCWATIRIGAGNAPGSLSYFTRTTVGGAEIKSGDCIIATYALVSLSLCPGCQDTSSPADICDCLNGGCIPAALYGTPGKYANLAACQSACAKDSNCIGECVSPAEIAALQQAANNLQSKICG